MVSVVTRGLLGKRYNCDFDGYCYRTPWDNWGRWVAFVVVALTIFLFALLFSRQSNRRRQSRGLSPMYGTGWIPGSKYNQANNTQEGYHAQQQQIYNHDPAPPYLPTYAKTYVPPASQPAAGAGTFDHNTRASGSTLPNPEIELQQPKHVHQPPQVDEASYDPPPGPPPGKR